MMPFLCVNQSHVFSSLQCRTLGNIKKRLMLAGWKEVEEECMGIGKMSIQPKVVLCVEMGKNLCSHLN